jgi:hypothetical protein
VRVHRGAIGQRYAIAAVPSPPDDGPGPPDPQGVGE